MSPCGTSLLLTDSLSLPLLDTSQDHSSLSLWNEVLPCDLFWPTKYKWKWHVYFWVKQMRAMCDCHVPALLHLTRDISEASGTVSLDPRVRMTRRRDPCWPAMDMKCKWEGNFCCLRIFEIWRLLFQHSPAYPSRYKLLISVGEHWKAIGIYLGFFQAQYDTFPPAHRDEHQIYTTSLTSLVWP